MKTIYQFAVMLSLVLLLSPVFAFEGALVQHSTDTFLDQENVWKTLKFDVEHYDLALGIEQWHDDEILEERFTVWSITETDKSGKTFKTWPKYVRLCAQLIFADHEDNDGQRLFQFKKNGLAFPGNIANDSIATVGLEVIQGCSAVIETQPDDYFTIEAIFYSPAINQMLVLADEGWIESWFSIEAVDLETVLVGVPE